MFRIGVSVSLIETSEHVNHLNPKDLENRLNHDTRFWSRPETQEALHEWIRSALLEDAASADLTAHVLSDSAVLSNSTVFSDSGALSDFDSADGVEKIPARGIITAKQSGVICGLEAVRQTLQTLEPEVRIVEMFADGTPVKPGDRVFVAESQAQPLLAGERTALNICSHLSGIATATARLVTCAGDVEILDTRKTLPGIRRFQKYAVTVGGGQNHRHDLSEFPMFKENHRALLQSLLPNLSKAPLEEVRWIKASLARHGYSGPISIEVEDEASLRACLQENIDMILVDNVLPEQLTQWLDRARADQLPVNPSQLEASGGIDAETLKDHATSGVGRISVGGITHSAKVLDLSMSVEPLGKNLEAKESGDADD